MKKNNIIALLLFLLSFFIYSENFSVSLWLHSSDFSNDKKIAVSELNEKLGFYKEIGVGNLYVFNTLNEEHKKGWSFLKTLIKIAHENDLKVHPSIVSGNRMRIDGKIKKRSHWLIKDQFGKTMPYLNLSYPKVRKYIQKKIKKLLRYKINGIHLDYIRFPYISSKNPGDSIMNALIRVLRVALSFYLPDHIYNKTADNFFSYDEETLKRFEEYYTNKSEIRSTKSETNPNDQNSNDPNKIISPSSGGAKGGLERMDVKALKSDSQKGDADGGMLNAERLYPPEIGSPSHVLKEWIRWNASNVTLLVKEIKEKIKRSGKNIPLSAAIFSNRKFAFHSLGQDWGEWGKEGIVDVLCPMLYSNSSNWFRERLRGVIETVKGKCKVYAGIALLSSTNKNTPQGVAEQIRIAKEEGADGVVIFSGNSLTEEYGQVIKEKVKRQK